jgi:hypothetical protein
MASPLLARSRAQAPPAQSPFKPPAAAVVSPSERAVAAAASLARRLDAPALSAALAKAPKSFLEKRSWLASVRAFSRLYSFYVAAFELLVCVAFLQHNQVDFRTQSAQWWHVLGSGTDEARAVDGRQRIQYAQKYWSSVRNMKRCVSSS